MGDLDRLVVLALGVLASCGPDGHNELGPSTLPLAEIPDEAVFVVNGGDVSISVLDPANDEVKGDIEIVGLEYSHHVYLDAAGSRMLATRERERGTDRPVEGPGAYAVLGVPCLRCTRACGPSNCCDRDSHSSNRQRARCAGDRRARR